MATRKKTTAAAHAHLVPADRDQASAAVRQLGDLQRAQAARLAQLDAAIAELQQAAAPTLTALGGQIEALHHAIQTWAEGHRAELTGNHKTKTVNLITGEISWRQRPPSVTVRNAETTVTYLYQVGLASLVRTTEEVNKQAILDLHSALERLDDADDSESATTLRGKAAALATAATIKVNRGLEDFIVSPSETVVDGVLQ
ncbi:MAG: host-nuclease inhibitor Gam family protein [Proteobacteria bacterium]|nr:host-nuclease inhibitor Gam family protein [Pseudomonadota bacterium]